MASPFPLLRLPRLALFDVLKSLSIGEKIKLSICSKKISNQINNARLYSQKVIVDLDMLNHGIRVCSENNEDKFDIFTKPGSAKSRHNSSTKHLSISCCRLRGTAILTKIRFVSVIQHLLKMFQCKFSIRISGYCGSSYHPTIFELFDLQLEVKTLIVNLDGSKDENLLWNQMFSKFGMVEDLYILTIFDSDSSPVCTSWPQNINILNSDWFTLETLLACTCTSITLKDSRLKNKDLDVILRKWKTGGFPNLKYLKIHGENIESIATTILGMTLSEMNLLELNGMVIQTDDGSKKATIRIGFCLNFRRIEMSVTPFE
ncbi:hypothetical protein GCK72_003148 [Caenorhabditis remanei]|uniref:F-box domain-containing protein n=1 Tax=Caenorhabditis remanei TaxID=31234 RepID=A0A6A5HYJ0_CAERE|nr:hypothetical protein GCK72_003148 [Caenorhabditis remanei]KAF1771322.1 hypothetical protein GCK72_003148 [Caenorhabditis remanei]